MLEAFKHLVESGVLSEQTKLALETAFNDKIQENREQVTAQLREEFAQKYNHDKGVIIESVEKLLSERLAAEMAELVQDKQALVEARIRYQKKMATDAKMMESFIAQQLAKELVEFQNDRQKVANEFERLEQFVNYALAEEIGEFAKDKQDLANTKVKLVREAKKEFAVAKKNFIERAAKIVESTVEKTLRSEIKQLREDIDSSRTNDFGRRIFEAFAQEYQHSHLNEKSSTARLLKIVNKKDKEITEAKIALKNAKKLVETKAQELSVQRDLNKRAKVMSDLLAPLSADKKNIMRELLESTETDRLANAFDKYLPAVMNDGTAKTKPAVLKESEVTGNRAVRKSEGGLDNIVDIRKLAGLK